MVWFQHKGSDSEYSAASGFVLITYYSAESFFFLP